MLELSRRIAQLVARDYWSQIIPARVKTMVQRNRDFVGTPHLSLEEWAALLRPTCGGDHQVIERNAFAGWMRRLTIYGAAAAAIKIQCGVEAVDHGSNVYRFERAHCHVCRA